MKKIFTSISMALCLAASSFNASAQQATQLSDAQKQEIQQKVLPVVFEQIKEQAGIDILGWAQPKLTADYLGNLPIFNQLQGNSGLRADGDLTAYSLRPDSILLDMSVISPDLATLGNAKIVMSEMDTLDLSLFSEMVLQRGLLVEMPKKITVSSPSVPIIPVLAEINLDYTTSESILLGVNVSMSIMGGEAANLVGLTVAFDQAGVFNINVDVESGDDYLITSPNLLMGILSNGIVSASMYSVQGETQNLMGNAEIAGLTLDALLGGGMPIQYIKLHDAGTSSWNKMWFDLNSTEENVVLTIENSSWTENWADSTQVENTTTITMTEYVNATNAQAAVQSVVNRAVTELATTGAASRYEMEIETTVGDMTVRVMDVTVTPSIEGTNAVATINIQPYENGAASTPIDIVATADLAGSNVIAVDVVMGETTVGSAYFTSNIAGIVTDNEDIQLANVEVTPVKDGIYVSGATTATYSIVSMSGATVANGTVSGDNAYISTSALAKGIYVIVVTENGESKAIKFAR